MPYNLPAGWTFEHAYHALRALGEVTLAMRKPGDWYCSAGGAHVGKGGTLTGKYGNGPTPEAAISECFRVLTELPPGATLVLHPMGPDCRHVRWNGFMWEDDILHPVLADA